jgi:hypothetical protein
MESGSSVNRNGFYPVIVMHSVLQLTPNLSSVCLPCLKENFLPPSTVSVGLHPKNLQIENALLALLGNSLELIDLTTHVKDEYS